MRYMRGNKNVCKINLSKAFPHLCTFSALNLLSSSPEIASYAGPYQSLFPPLRVRFGPSHAEKLTASSICSCHICRRAEKARAELRSSGRRKVRTKSSTCIARRINFYAASQSDTN